MKLKSIFLAALLCLTRAVSSSPSGGWRLGEIPLRADGERVVDPDGILSKAEVQVLKDKIISFEENHTIPAAGVDTPIQIAFAIVKKMNLDPFLEYEDEMEDYAAKSFAMDIHDKLGVGYNTEAGGTGILVFLSTYDRVMFVSRGGAVEKRLSNSRIDRLIHDLRHLLRGAKYGDAFSTAMDEIGGLIEKGDPTWKESVYEAFMSLYPFLIFLSIVLGVVYFSAAHERRQQREYAQVESQLSELDRTRAEALRGQYQATSCPICLEDFISETIGSDEQPVKLLRCGHVFDESCWAEWVNSGRGNLTQCPICKADVGGSSTATAPSAVGTNNENEVRARNQDARNQEGVNHQVMNMVQEETTHAHVQAEPDRAMRQYVRERNFRLARIATRFPRYVGQQQVQRWSNPNYSESLAQDSQFRQNNPAVQRSVQQTQSSYGGSNRSFSGFGGGGSSGGRGGRW